MWSSVQIVIFFLQNPGASKWAFLGLFFQDFPAKLNLIVSIWCHFLKHNIVLCCISRPPKWHSKGFDNVYTTFWLGHFSFMLPQMSTQHYWRTLLTPHCQAVQGTRQMQHTHSPPLTLCSTRCSLLLRDPVSNSFLWLFAWIISTLFTFISGTPLRLHSYHWDEFQQGWRAQEGRCNSKMLWHLYLELLLRSHAAMLRLVLPFITFIPSPTTGPRGSHGYSLIEECKEVSHYNQRGLRQVQKHFPDVECSLL